MGEERFDWDTTGNLTPMGQVDGMGRLARGAKRFSRGGQPRSGRWVWVTVALLVVGAAALALLAVLSG